MFISLYASSGPSFVSPTFLAEAEWPARVVHISGEGMSGRALVVGVSGQVGAEMLRQIAADRGSGYALPSAREAGPGREGWLTLDLATLDESGVEALLAPYDLREIFCVAGLTDVEGCEGAPELAERTNARGPAVLAGYARQRDLPFVYYSTEYVFDGDPRRPGPYREEDPTRALSAYGRSKLDGEEAVLRAHPGALVLRTTVVYGPDARGKNYVYSLMRNLGTGRRMRVPADQVSTPTYNRDLVRTTLGLVSVGASGIWHTCGPELLSRMEFAREVAEFLGLDAGLLDPVPTAELGQRAPRPLAAGMSIDKLRGRFPDLPMRTVAQSLADCEPELRAFLRQL